LNLSAKFYESYTRHKHSPVWGRKYLTWYEKNLHEFD